MEESALTYFSIIIYVNDDIKLCKYKDICFMYGFVLLVLSLPLHK